MAANYYVRPARAAANNAEQFSGKTANVDLSATDWAAAVDTDNGSTEQYRCPRAFIPNADGTISATALENSATVPTVVKAGTMYPIAIRAITRASCSASLQIANAVTLVY